MAVKKWIILLKLFSLSLNIFELFNKNKIITRNLQESDLLCSLRYTLQNQIFVSNLKHILSVKFGKRNLYRLSVNHSCDFPENPRNFSYGHQKYAQSAAGRVGNGGGARLGRLCGILNIPIDLLWQE